MNESRTKADVAIRPQDGSTLEVRNDVTVAIFDFSLSRAIIPRILIVIQHGDKGRDVTKKRHLSVGLFVSDVSQLMTSFPVVTLYGTGNIEASQADAILNNLLVEIIAAILETRMPIN